MENLDNMDWEELPPLLDNTNELKQIRKNLRKRSSATVLTCFLLAAALLLCSMGVEKLFWDPEKNTYDLEYFNDLELMLMTYSELFAPSQTATNVSAEHTGFGSYLLTIHLWENYGLSESNYRTASMTRGTLEFPAGFWDSFPINHFARASYPAYFMAPEQKQRTYDSLSGFADYIAVRAAVSFPEDLTMEQLLEFNDSLGGEAYVCWVGIRNSPVDQQRYPLCGMKPFNGGYVVSGMNDYYPCFDIKWQNQTAEDLETHFKSLLQFSLDQVNANAGIDNINGQSGDYYKYVLEYVEESGVMTYGCYVVGTPQLFLDLLDSGIASQVWLQDAWIDVG